MTAAAPKRPPPVIGQLRDGAWAVFNMPVSSPLWTRTFETREQAERALRIDTKVREHIPREAAS
jgi:hypothetical protein